MQGARRAGPGDGTGASDRAACDDAAAVNASDVGRILGSRRVRLEPDLSSGSAARRLLRTALEETGCTEWIDETELALGEVVANAVLHAHTSIEVSLEVGSTGVYVEVRDANPMMPIPRDYDLEATTGRGMALVAAITRQCGVRSLGQDGKVVWFAVGAMTPADEEEVLLDAWDSWADLEPESVAADSERTAEGVVDVVLTDLPPLLWLAARQHHDALTRELVLHAAENDVPGIEFAASDRARATVSETLIGRLEEMRRSAGADPGDGYSYRGSQPWMPVAVDLVVPIQAALGPSFAMLQDMLDTAERLAAEGDLFTSPGLPEIIEVRDWVCDQVVAQLAGVPPSPWPGSAQTRYETTSRQRAGDTLEWDATVVTESRRGVAAADDANRILAVSGPLARALGWEVDDLVGRRVVTLIPPSLRESHVAAFTRHLSTGEVHVLGRSLHLPVLCKDGSEVMSEFKVEQAAHAHGRTIFLAWIEPLV
jgi:PAS domain S-box-containing protein